MGIDEIYELHRRSKDKVNLLYKRPSGRLGHCYIDPKKPLRRSYIGNNYGYIVENKADLQGSDNLTIGVFKQQGGVEIFVKPADLWVHKKNAEMVIKVLYGKAD